MRKLTFLAILLSVGLWLRAQVTGTATLTVSNTVVSWSTTFQTIDGFGGADLAGAGLQSSTYFQQDILTAAQADTLFSTSVGAGLSLVRLAPDDGSALVSSALLAIARGAKVWLSPFQITPYCNTSTLLVDPTQFAAYATFLNNYIQNTMIANGITPIALSVQNEPNATDPYACEWTPTQVHDFIKNNLGPTLAAGARTPIMMPETWNWSGFSYYADPVIGDAGAAQYVTYYAAHNYDYLGGSPTPLSVPAGKHTWMSEKTDLESVSDLSMADGLTWATRIYQWVVLAGVNAYSYWTVWPHSGNECFICPEGVAKRLWTFGNYSKFVRPGWIRIDVQTNFSGVLISAYKNTSTGAFAIVAVNNNSSSTPIALTFNGFTSSTVTPHITSATQNLVDLSAVTAGSGLSYTLPAQSVVTFTGTNGG